jgi:hypothetical protein
VVYHRVAHIIEWRTFPHPITCKLQHAFFQPFVMEIQTQEARIILAIEAIRSSKNLSRRSAAKIYKVPETTLRHRMAGSEGNSITAVLQPCICGLNTDSLYSSTVYFSGSIRLRIQYNTAPRPYYHPV